MWTYFNENYANMLNLWPKSGPFNAGEGYPSEARSGGDPSKPEVFVPVSVGPSWMRACIVDDS